MRILTRLIAGRLKAVWEKIPVRTDRKIRVKNFLFSRAGFLFFKLEAYKNWQRMSGPRGALVGSGDALFHHKEEVEFFPSYISFKENLEKASLDTKVIAFYLPQFHVIPENDEWWGEGFTEWSNVKPAKPLYAGHYQPHIPDDAIGYYDLLNSNVQKKQIELAKNYGVSGFCYYFYWFSGRRLLESPLLNLLKNESLDFPFCLCWANENWSRRWDGLESELLITQDYSEADDLAFIEYVSKYIKDRRYIRIDGKPLLIVYRPSLFPNVRKTVKLWRKWCLDNGIGEILLGYTQSFEAVNPQKYGFDLAIEFPPNGTNPPDMTEKVFPFKKDFQGLVYDWSIYLDRSKSYESRSYPLARGVCPSWDNTARKKNRSISFINSSPCGFQQWLCSALIDTQNESGRNKVDAVFVNAWNEWAEGAHLEPDKKYGFAWLEAVRMARVRAELIAKSDLHKDRLEKVAFVVHAFHMDILEEIFSYLVLGKSSDSKVFLSVTSEKDRVKAHKFLEGANLEFEVVVYENRGRDVLPFLKIMRLVISQGYDVVVKLHTKKTLHRNDGEKWRNDLYAKLLSEEKLSEIICFLRKDPSLGIVGPEGHVLPLDSYYGSNASKVWQLGERLGVSRFESDKINFVAGTMFVAKTLALMPLIKLGLDEDDFEPECGQIDGTLAHAIERCIAISASSINMRVASLDGKIDAAYRFASLS